MSRINTWIVPMYYYCHVIDFIWLLGESWRDGRIWNTKRYC